MFFLIFPGFLCLCPLGSYRLDQNKVVFKYFEFCTIANSLGSQISSFTKHLSAPKASFGILFQVRKLFRGASLGNRQIEARSNYGTWNSTDSAQLCVACSYLGFKCVCWSTDSEAASCGTGTHARTTCIPIQSPVTQSISNNSFLPRFMEKVCCHGSLTGASRQLLLHKSHPLVHISLFLPLSGFISKEIKPCIHFLIISPI